MSQPFIFVFSQVTDVSVNVKPESVGGFTRTAAEATTAP